jgi:uncharacterized protein YceH (UPF0502 family)
MKMNLTEVEIRILGCLIEKELTTPENYPLSLNALTNACNQKSNRAPLMVLVEADVVSGLDKLGSRGLARHTTAVGGWAAKYRHSLDDSLHLAPPALAVLAELMLRGPQTAGELRNRAERMTPFTDIASVEEILAALMAFGPPLVTRLPRQPGHKEQRYVQLFAGEPILPADAPAPLPEPARQRVMTESERLARLDSEVSALREEIDALRCTIEELIAQFK